MSVGSGVVDTSVFKGIADLHAGVMSEDPVVAPAHEVVQDSDMVADPSIPLSHADAAPEHGGDTAAHSTEDAPAGDADHVYADADQAYADHAYADHTVADMDHSYADHAYADHAVADMDHTYADHAYADVTVPDSAVSFADHSMMPADDGTPHSLGADAGQQGDDSHLAGAWWWAGGIGVAGGTLGYFAGHDTHDAASTSGAATEPVYVVVERGEVDGMFTGAAFIDVNHNGVQDAEDDVLANFGHGGNADLATNTVFIHFNDIPLEALNLTGFGTDDRIQFHVQSLIDHNIVSNAGSHNSVMGQYLTDLNINVATSWVNYAFATPSGYSNGAEIDIHQNSSTFTRDFNDNAIDGKYYMDISNIVSSIYSISGETWTSSAAFAYWSDLGNALNNNLALFPNFSYTQNTYTYTSLGVVYTGINTNANEYTVRENLNNNNEGGVVDFIWPAGVYIG